MLTLVFDNLDKPNAHLNSGISPDDSLPGALLYYRLPFIKEHISNSPKHRLSYYHIQPIHFDTAFGFNCNGFIDSISSTALSKLQDLSDGLNLLIYFPWEGYDLMHYDYITIKYLNKLITHYKIPPTKIKFCYGDLNISTNLFERDIKCSLLKSNVLGLNIFEGVAYEDYSRTLTPLDIPSPVSRPKRFILKNGVARTQRMYIAGAVKSKNLLDHFYFSWLNSQKLDYNSYDGDLLLGTFSMFNNGILNQEYYDSFIELTEKEPIILDITQDEATDRNNQITNTRHFYNTSYASIVTETVADEYNTNVKFISEKLYQPIYNLHPFIVFGGRNLLEELRQSGYFTFPELFDESYDSEADCSIRINSAITSVEKFCNMDINQLNDIYYSSYLQDKLTHNWENFIYRSGKQNIEVLYKWLTNKK